MPERVDDANGGVYLLHVSQHVLPAVKHPSALLRIQLVDEVSSVVYVGVLVPKGKKMDLTSVSSSPFIFQRHGPSLPPTDQPLPLQTTSSLHK